jgi:outer membrane protein assembly factor BamE (lipoprotein component of BamABCDE complex)
MVENKVIRRGKILALIFLLLLLLFPVFHDLVRYRYNINDIIISKVMFPFVEIKTLWSEQYSENRFHKINRGMSKLDVTNLIGNPLFNECHLDACIWQYTLPVNDTSSYHRRIVFFNSAGEVTNTISELFYD